MPHQPRVHGKIIAKFQGLDYRNPGLFHPVAARLTLAQCWSIWITIVMLHGLLWAFALWQSGGSWASLLQHWDAGWYFQIVTQGYDEPARTAFPPLYPYLVRGLTGMLGLQSEAAILWTGTIFSLVCFGLALNLLFEQRRTRLWAMLIFLWSPASYIFHSFHTESLFLLLSVLGFTALQQKRWWLAAIWAGIAALVRHQGVLLAIGVAFGGAMLWRGWWRRGLIFAAMGLISGAIWALMPVLHYSEGRGWFPAFAAHESHWFLAQSVSTYFKTFLLANPIQNLRWGSLAHHALYGLWLLGTVLVFRRGRFAEAVYCFLSLAIMPLQGELVDAFRFGAVLFPLLFALGDSWERWPRWLSWPAFAGYGALNLLVTWQYGIQRWAY